MHAVSFLFFSDGETEVRKGLGVLAWSPRGSQAHAPSHILDVAPAPLNVNTPLRTVPSMPGPTPATPSQQTEQFPQDPQSWKAAAYASPKFTH